MATTARKKPEKLDSVFLTGHGGMVYEFPRAVAEKHALTMDRIAELGHMPVTPYGTKVPDGARSGAAAGAETGDVEGRHMALNVYGEWVWHSNYLYGTFLAVDGYYYRGEHYHPYATELGFV
jgi:hypothetical protein